VELRHGLEVDRIERRLRAQVILTRLQERAARGRAFQEVLEEELADEVRAPFSSAGPYAIVLAPRNAYAPSPRYALQIDVPMCSVGAYRSAP
jgi:hypothetical protein